MWSDIHKNTQNAFIRSFSRIRLSRPIFPLLSRRRNWIRFKHQTDKEEEDGKKLQFFFLQEKEVSDCCSASTPTQKSRVFARWKDAILTLYILKTFLRTWLLECTNVSLNKRLSFRFPIKMSGVIFLVLLKKGKNNNRFLCDLWAWKKKLFFWKNKHRKLREAQNSFRKDKSS